MIGTQIKVLVTGAGSQIAYGCIKSLRESPRVSTIITADINHNVAGAVMGDRFFVTPKASDNNFIEEIVEIVSRESIDVIIPCSCFELIRFASEREQIPSQVIVENLQTIEMFSDKFLTAQFLISLNIPCPQTYLVSPGASIDDWLDQIEFPLFAKPRLGYGSKRATLICKRTNLDNWLELVDSPFVLQEYLPEDQGEYSALATYLPNGEVSSTMVIRRDKIRKGITVHASYDSVCRRFERIIAEYAALLPGRYCLNLQFRIRQGKPCIFEINPRFGASESIRTKLGFNAYLNVLSHYFSSMQLPKRRTFRKVIRMYEDIVLPLEQVD